MHRWTQLGTEWTDPRVLDPALVLDLMLARPDPRAVAACFWTLLKGILWGIKGEYEGAWVVTRDASHARERPPAATHITSCLNPGIGAPPLVNLTLFSPFPAFSA